MAVRHYLFTFLALAALASCASISEDASRAGDWESVGFRDGAAGRSPDYFLNHAEACNAFGIAPVKSVWTGGYSSGLERYCTPETAFDEGQSGDRLNNVCPAENLAELRRANERGLDWHRLGQDIAENERRIRSINALLFKLPDVDGRRVHLVSERSLLRLENLRLRSRQSLIRL
ncbi:MAG: DUF2799 domain-containing protein [Pseudomonadota bacterium]